MLPWVSPHFRKLSTTGQGDYGLSPAYRTPGSAAFAPVTVLERTSIWRLHQGFRRALSKHMKIFVINKILFYYKLPSNSHLFLQWGNKSILLKLRVWVSLYFWVGREASPKYLQLKKKRRSMKAKTTIMEVENYFSKLRNCWIRNLDSCFN